MTRGQTHSVHPADEVLTREPPPGWFLPPGYTARSDAAVFDDTAPTAEAVVHQPDIYPFAAHLARRYGCRNIIDVGCGGAAKLARLHPEFNVIGIDLDFVIARCRRHYPFGRWISHDVASRDALRLPSDVLGDSIVVCADVIEHVGDPRSLLALLRTMLRSAPAGLISTPERDLVRGKSHLGPPLNPFHVREWNREELGQLLRWAGLNVSFLGLTLNDTGAQQKRTTLALCEMEGAVRPTRAPRTFDVLAVMTVYNERDVLEATVGRLLDQEIRVRALDNWSTDGSYELLEALGRKYPALTVERCPAEGADHTYRWRRMLRRVEEVSASSGADWVIHHDADEVRSGPWSDLSLKDSLYSSQLRGFNAIDFTVLNFVPTTTFRFVSGDPERDLPFFEFGTSPAQLIQRKSWRNTGERVDLASSGGHEVTFLDRRTEPYNYLLKHYPIRSDDHGRRKIFLERRPRWDDEERAADMHRHYDHVSDQEHRFARAEDSLLPWSDDFDVVYMTERLGRVGIHRFSELDVPLDDRSDDALRRSWQGALQCSRETEARFFALQVLYDEAVHELTSVPRWWMSLYRAGRRLVRGEWKAIWRRVSRRRTVERPKP